MGKSVSLSLLYVNKIIISESSFISGGKMKFLVGIFFAPTAVKVVESD